MDASMALLGVAAAVVELVASVLEGGGRMGVLR